MQVINAGRTMAVKIGSKWANIIAMVHDLDGYKVIVWQAESGKVGAIYADGAEVSERKL